MSGQANWGTSEELVLYPGLCSSLAIISWGVAIAKPSLGTEEREREQERKKEK